MPLDHGGHTFNAQIPTDFVRSNEDIFISVYFVLRQRPAAPVLSKTRQHVELGPSSSGSCSHHMCGFLEQTFSCLQDNTNEGSKQTDH